jgi:Flp pilus assembly protein TadG
MKPRHHTAAAAGREGGAIILTFSLMLLFLIGFAGIAIDFSRLFIVRAELQTALDSCALAAAQELDGQSTSKARAINAGIAAANLNRVNLQSANWDGQAKVGAGDISFFDSTNTATADSASARYVQCQHSQAGVHTFLLQLLTRYSADGYPNTHSVYAVAVATRGHAQSTCPIPVALRAKVIKGVQQGAPNYGFLPGEWVTIYGKKTGAAPGEMGWYNLDGSSNASETAAELAENGKCGVKAGDTLGTPGAQTSVDVSWNQRFGIYKNNDSPSASHPDFTGYAYTKSNWTSTVPQNAFKGNGGIGATAKNYLVKRAAFASLDDTGSDLKDGAQIAFGDKNALNSFKSVATPGAGGEHATFGYNRRIVLVPVLGTTSAIADFACMLMLAPLTGPNGDGQMEFIGNASAVDSPCTTNGVAGGVAGPLVPVLVR